MSENLGYTFWKNLDACKGELSITEIAKRLSLNYRGILDQRTSNRLPRLEDAYKISQALGVSIEYLLTGESGTMPIKEEAEAVNSDPELRALVRAVMRDRRLLSAISAVVMSSERMMGEGMA